MKRAIMYAVVKPTYGMGPIVMAVTSTKQNRYWGRDVDTDTPMQVTGENFYAGFSGEGAQSRARFVLPLVEAALQKRSVTRRSALTMYESLCRTTDGEFKSALAEITKGLTSE